MRRGLPVAAAFVAAIGMAPGVTAQGATITVSADGSADHDTIGAAIEAADPGDTVLIAPGTYVESLVIGKPITLRGDGPREEIVIAPDPTTARKREVPDDDPATTHVFVDGVDATIESLSLGDDERIQAGLMLTGGNPVVRDIVSPRIIGVNGDIEATIEGSELGRIIVMGPDAHTSVRDSTIDDAMLVGMGATAVLEDNHILEHPIEVFDDSHLDARGNTFRPEEGSPAIWVNYANGSATIADNVIEGGWQSIVVEHGGTVLIEGNTITEPEFGIMVVETDAIVRTRAR